MGTFRIEQLSDSELADLAMHIYTIINSSPAEYGATEVQADEFKTNKDTFESDLTAHISAQAAARSKTQAKEASRERIESSIRFFLKQAKLHKVSEEKIASLNVPTESAAELPSATKPVGRIATNERFRHIVNFADESTPNSKRNPRGVFGCEIYVKIGGAPPTSVKECVPLGIDRKTPYLSEFDAEDVGKMAHYMFRWRFNDESTSAWSETVSATITG
ncbi:MAG TPA: hypothetical protein PKY59_11700 [Pyrinomonadaceae bacterium]|nr:hypothetical protein [Pyrinomonadaceae bacterium]